MTDTDELVPQDDPQALGEPSDDEPEDEYEDEPALEPEPEYADDQEPEPEPAAAPAPVAPKPAAQAPAVSVSDVSALYSQEAEARLNEMMESGDPALMRQAMQIERQRDRRAEGAFRANVARHMESAPAHLRASVQADLEEVAATQDPRGLADPAAAQIAYWAALGKAVATGQVQAPRQPAQRQTPAAPKPMAPAERMPRGTGGPAASTRQASAGGLAAQIAKEQGISLRAAQAMLRGPNDE
jgi:hypothetical protein